MSARRQSAYLQKHTATTMASLQTEERGRRAGEIKKKKNWQTDETGKKLLTKFLSESERWERIEDFFMTKN